MNEPVWVSEDFVISLHDLLLTEFGGGAGIRDRALLESALSRPQNLYSYETPDLFTLAAAYVNGLLRNHPFTDGNKRTAFMTGYVFLAKNGKELLAPEPNTTAIIMALTNKTVTEQDFATWLRHHCE